MPTTTDTVDPSLADGTSVFTHDGRWALRRRDGVFVQIDGDASRELATETTIGSHPTLGPAFADRGFLRGATESHEDVQVEVAGDGVLRDVVGGLLADVSHRTSGREHPVTLFDAPPPIDFDHPLGVVVWPEGTLVFITPCVDAADEHPVTVSDVLRRRIAAAGLPVLLAAYFEGRRRAPVTIDAAAALLVSSLALEQVVAGRNARRRLRVVDLDAWTWVDRTILPIPQAPPRHRT